MQGTAYEQGKAEHRVLSLASSIVFLLSFAVVLATVRNRTASPFFALIANHGALLISVPTLIPCLGVVRLTRLRLLEKRHTPFVDGWLIHLAILLPCTIFLVAILR